MTTTYCKHCNGYGHIAIHGDDDVICKVCKGTGNAPRKVYVRKQQVNGHWRVAQQALPPDEGRLANEQR